MIKAVTVRNLKRFREQRFELSNHSSSGET